jgi:hypothetical protein
MGRATEKMTIDRKKLLSAGQLAGDARFEEDEIAEITQLWSEATEFLEAHEWCLEVIDQYLSFSSVPILCVFLADVKVLAPATSPLWVIVGDIPPAFIDVAETENAAEALQDYCAAMAEWVRAVRGGDSLNDLIPVRERGSLHLVQADIEVANALQARLDFISREIVPRAVG